jgi:ribosomal protein S12 methylthiotransferase accessory factor
VQAAWLPDRLSAEAALLRTRGAAEPCSDRLHLAEETVARMRPRFDALGITRIAQVTGLDRVGIPVWMAVRPNSRTLSVSQGKGLSDSAAKASAVMEAAELAVAERPPLPVTHSSLDQLRHNAIAADPLHNLLGRGASTPAASEAMDWVEGFDLLKRQSILVPADVVALDRTHEPCGRPCRYWRSSDGLASGNLLLEAIFHGLCERIERDALILWQFFSEDQVFDRCIDPADLDDPHALELADRVANAGLQLRLFDITSDVGVPVFFATIAPPPDGRERYWKHLELSSGSGCHPSPARAAIRAVTEAAQSRVTTISGARDDYEPSLYAATLTPDLLVYVQAEPRRRLATSSPCDHQPTDNLSFLLSRLVSAKIDSAIAVPLHVDDDFAVAKVLVPGLEHLPGDRRQRFGKRAVRAMMSLQ